jgi:hypothetical protein
MSRTISIMIDLETLGTRPDAQIVQLAAIPFEPRSGGKIYLDKAVNAYVLPQDGIGSIDASTLMFWLQEPSAKLLGAGLEKHGVPLAVALNQLILLPSMMGLSWGDVEGVWAKPANFDLPILASAFAKCGNSVPWLHWTTRCARTLFELIGGEPQIDTTGLVKHNALHDAEMQILRLQKTFALLDANTIRR